MRNRPVFALIFLGLFSFIIFSASVSAQEQQSLGTFDQGTCIVLKQTCSNCSFVNVTRITAQSSSNIKLQGNFAMTRTDTIYNRTFCNTTELGTYVLDWKADPSGIITAGNYDFLITPSGTDDNSIGNVILLGFIIAISFSIILFGFNKGDPWIVILGSLLAVALALYTLLNGMGNYRNTATQAFSMITLFTALYISIRSGLEAFNEF